MKSLIGNTDERLGCEESNSHENASFDRKKVLQTHILELLREFRRHRNSIEAFVAQILRRNAPMDQVAGNAIAPIEEGFHSIKAIIDLMVLTAQRLGEQVFEKISLQICKSIKSKVFSEEANQIRFASLYKMELRRHVTIENIQQEILCNKQMTHRFDVRSQRSALMEASTDRSISGSKYQFRLHALDRVLQAARRPHCVTLRYVEETKQFIYSSDASDVAEVQSLQNRVDMLAKKTDLSHQWIQSKCGLKKKTLIFKKLVQILSTIPLFSVSIRHSSTIEHDPSSFLDDVVEFALAASYASLPLGSPLCLKDHPMQELFVIVDGSIGGESASALYLGEMAFLDPDALWSQTWRVTSPMATVFSLTSKDFDKVLTRLLGLGNERISKRDSPLLSTHHSPRASSRRLSITARTHKGGKLSKIDLYKANRNIWDDKVSVKKENNLHLPLLDAPKKHEFEAVNASEAEAHKPIQLPIASDVQYYPSFKVSTYRTEEDQLRHESDMSLFDRPFLRSMPPIAFPVLKMDDIVADALMPILPETECAAFSSSDTNVYASLFTQPNVLRKDVLRGLLEQSDYKNDSMATSPHGDSSDTEASPFGDAQIQQSEQIVSQGESSSPSQTEAREMTSFNTLQNHWNRRRSTIGKREQSRSTNDTSSAKTSPDCRPGALVDPIENRDSLVSTRRSSLDDEFSEGSHSDENSEFNASVSFAVAHRIHRLIVNKQRQPLTEPPGDRTDTLSSSSLVQDTATLNTEASLPIPLKMGLQHRMTKVFDQLGMTAKQKLIVVLKYTSGSLSFQFADAVACWEQATYLIMEREILMAKVDQFEYNASDPRRFFKTLSTKRLEEERERKKIIHQLHQLTIACDKALLNLEKFGDESLLCFNGEERSYREKLSKDYTEVLYAGEQKRLSVINDTKDATVLAHNEVQVRGKDEEQRVTAPSLAGPRLELPSLISATSARNWDQNKVLLRFRRQANLLRTRRQMEAKKADTAHTLSSALSSRTLAGKFQVSTSTERRIPTPPSRNNKQL